MELLWALLVLLWNLTKIAFYVWAVWGVLTGRIVWKSKSDA